MTVTPQDKREGWKVRVKAALIQAFRWGRRIPPGVRSILGLLLIAGGALGFLPVLGFWMMPLGAVLVCLDIPPLRRRLRDRLARRGKRPPAQRP